ncbi:DUF4145 domain-containing protein [Aquitalea magnusonii]|uniref:DUF4145 domain-containing protein n=1 Tax=Aquitalea magnusonii TaxID=332411 RepID=UPI00142E161B|nr:DUF4145 domain-containing protein [Aquitalea magnusonii]
MQKYYPPEHKKREFHCIHCGVFSSQHWREFYFHSAHGSYSTHQSLNFCICSHCKEWSYWYEGRMIVPSAAPVPPAHPDMPESCLLDYNEAREVVATSPRAASALLRLSLQKLMSELGERGKNINDDIGSLVTKGLPIEVQQALDFCRVVGNNAVHPGEIEINDTPEIAHNLFTMMNFIIEDRISRPKYISALYSQLPEGARKAIEKRDGAET